MSDDGEPLLRSASCNTSSPPRTARVATGGTTGSLAGKLAPSSRSGCGGSSAETQLLRSQVSECKAKIVELQAWKEQRLEDEDYMGAHHAKQLIQEQEQKLQGLRRQLDALPLPSRVETVSKGPRVSLSAGGRRPSPRRASDVAVRPAVGENALLVGSPRECAQVDVGDATSQPTRFSSLAAVAPTSSPARSIAVTLTAAPVVASPSRKVDDSVLSVSGGQSYRGVSVTPSRAANIEPMSEDEDESEEEEAQMDVDLAAVGGATVIGNGPRRQDEIMASGGVVTKERPSDEENEELNDVEMTPAHTNEAIGEGGESEEDIADDGDDDDNGEGQWHSCPGDLVELSEEGDAAQGSDNRRTDGLRGPFQIPQDVFDRLYPYQRSGVAWMARLARDGHGGVLADEMGLGKTVQVCAFFSGARKAGATHALLLLPVTLLDQWHKEARIWCPGWPVYKYCGTHVERARALRRVFRPAGGILLTSYNLLATDDNLFGVAVDDPPTPVRRRKRKAGAAKRRRTDDDDVEDEDSCEEEVIEPEIPVLGLPEDGAEKAWDIVVCDEAHRMKNISTLLGKSLRRLRANCRILLTGTPVQNALQDLWSLMDFAQPGLLGNHATFVKRFSEPIDKGSVRGCTPFQVQLKKHLAEQLRALISPHILRRTKAGAGLVDGGEGGDSENQLHGAELREDAPLEDGELKRLPPKRETIIWLTPSEDQVSIYQKVLEKSELIREACSKLKLGIEVFRAIGLLKRLCNHPLIVLPTQKASVWAELLADCTGPAAEAQFACGNPTVGTLENQAADAEGLALDLSDPQVDRSAPAAEGVVCRNGAGSAEDEQELAELQQRYTATFGKQPSGWWSKNISTLKQRLVEAGAYGSAETEDDIRAGRAIEMQLRKLPRDPKSIRMQSAKLRCLSSLLPSLAAKGHRTLVFSHSVKMLDLVQICCLKPYNLRCLRIDGQTDTQLRAEKVNKFQTQRERFQFMLLTTHVGGVGLNLTSADRVVLVDPAWNPAVDAQAVDRAFRIGQEKEVRVYRLIMSGLIEDKMFRLQVFKMGLTKTALEADNTKSYFTAREIRALFEWTDPAQGETRQLLIKDHGNDGDSSVGDAANDDGASEGWLQAGPAVGLSDFGLLFGAGSASKDEEPDDVCAAQVMEAQAKLGAADEKMQRMVDARESAILHCDKVAQDLEEANSSLEELKDKYALAVDVLREKRHELLVAKKAESVVLMRVEKATRARASLQEQRLRTSQAATTSLEASESAARTASDSVNSALNAEEAFVKTLSDVADQLSIVDDFGSAVGQGVVDADSTTLKRAVKSLDSVKLKFDALAARQAELDMADEEVMKADCAYADASAADMSLRASHQATKSSRVDVQSLMAKKSAEFTLKSKEKERQKAEQFQAKALQKVETAREALSTAVQALSEAGPAFAESLQKAKSRSGVRVDNVKTVQVKTRGVFRQINPAFQAAKKARDICIKAFLHRRKTNQKWRSSAAVDAETERLVCEADREYAEAVSMEEQHSAERVKCERAVVAAESEKASAEVAEAEKKRRRDKLKGELPAAKEAVKAAKASEKEASNERQQLHTACSKVEKEASFVEEAMNSAIQSLQTEEYDSQQVLQAYEKCQQKRSIAEVST
eukprot:TRINITY_DN11011_c0_g1_i3.p1 TRINITY_DN11011_c0_g1~~TRINITY_DN11011_c0_g1_i3.p1  ORF type:complete len:1682 (+),score=369.33 TRINITY_DN11011_c0_g1_i3:164-5047(+)